MSSTNELSEVNGMSNTSLGDVKGVLSEMLVRYSRNVEINAPNNKQSEARNNHMASLLLEIPVFVS